MEAPETAVVVLPTSPAQLAASPLAALSFIPEEELWLQNQRSPKTRRAYRNDVRQFCRELQVGSLDELRLVSRAAVVAWQRKLEARGAAPKTIRRKLSALSSLFTHLVEHGVGVENPVREVKAPSRQPEARNHGVL